jgi:hypothetical protein
MVEMDSFVEGGLIFLGFSAYTFEFCNFSFRLWPVTKLPIANPADISPLSAGKTHNNRYYGFILTVRRSGGKP